jgi:hypothetical protein
MNLNIYSIKDSKAGTFSQPFYSVNHSTAIRSFNASIQDPTNPLSNYPNDFSLYHLGTWEDREATITLNNVEFVADAVGKKEEDK